MNNEQYEIARLLTHHKMFHDLTRMYVINMKNGRVEEVTCESHDGMHVVLDGTDIRKTSDVVIDLLHNNNVGSLLGLMWRLQAHAYLTGSEQAGYQVELPGFMFKTGIPQLFHDRALGVCAAKTLLALLDR